MNLANVQARHGLSATVTPIGTGASGSLTVGTSLTNTNFDGADVVYTLRAIMVASTNQLVLDVATNNTTGSTSFVAGTSQVETATIVAASGATSSGNLPVVITSGVVAGSPLTVNVALVSGTHTTATIIANKCATDLNASAAGTHYFFGNSGANLLAVRKPTSEITVPGGTLSIYPATDSTLNIEIPAGLGVTAAPTSTGTTAGTATSGTKIYDGDGKDVEGETLPTIGELNGILLELASGTVTYTNDDTNIEGSLQEGALPTLSGDSNFLSTLTFVSTGLSDLTITVIGTT